MYLTEHDRAALQESLKKAIPSIEHPETRMMFTLMFALLCDHEELAQARQKDAKAHMTQLRTIEGSLREMVRNMAGGIPETRLWQ